MAKFIPVFFGIVENGKLEIEKDQRYEEYLFSLKGEVEVVVSRRKKRRTYKQNDLYWAYLRLISEAYGDSIGDLHEYFKKEFLPEKKIQILRGKVESQVTSSTTLLSTAGFKEYLGKIEHLVEIPVPNMDNVEIK